MVRVEEELWDRQVVRNGGQGSTVCVDLGHISTRYGSQEGRLKYGDKSGLLEGRKVGDGVHVQHSSVAL